MHTARYAKACTTGNLSEQRSRELTLGTLNSFSRLQTKHTASQYVARNAKQTLLHSLEISQKKMPETDNEDERAPLLPNDQSNTLYRTLSRISEPAELVLPPDDTDTNAIANEETPAPSSDNNVWTTLSVLLLGVFISQTDASLVMAVYAKVASEFNDLDSGSWLMSAYILAQCVAQPLYGKLSDLFGRKALLQLSYVLFAVGTAGAGLSLSMGAVIVSRAVQGAGSAGMLAMVSIIITDLVPMNEVAVFRSYVNILATSGRSCGGVIGGLLSSALGWRW